MTRRTLFDFEQATLTIDMLTKKVIVEGCKCMVPEFENDNMFLQWLRLPLSDIDLSVYIQ